MAEDLIKVRNQLKKKKPTFIRRQANQFPKLAKSGWRAPKGMGNKVRRGRKGQSKTPKVGYGSPRLVKGLNKNGLREVLVQNVSDLNKINTKTDIAVIGRTVGGRKTLAILNEGASRSMKFANFKDVDAKKSSLAKKSEPKMVTKPKMVASGKKVESKKKEDKSSKPKTAAKKKAKTKSAETKK